MSKSSSKKPSNSLAQLLGRDVTEQSRRDTTTAKQSNLNSNNPFANLKKELKTLQAEQKKADVLAKKVAQETERKQQLSNRLQQMRNQAAPHTTNQTPDYDEDSQRLFMQAMQGVQALDQSETLPMHLSKYKREVDSITLAKRAAAEGKDKKDELGISDNVALLHPISPEAVLSFKQRTLQNKVFNLLKTGKMRWHHAVDLHGCTMEQAREAVLALIVQCQQENQTVLKIVHGKGQQSVLKTCVNGWLRQHPMVLAFSSAPEEQGGTGSVLVLLKKNTTSVK